MDVSEFRSELIKWDAKSLDDRVNRWMQIKPGTYNVPLPDLVWEYLTEADDMYIRGHYLATITLCATTMELVIAHQLKSVDNMIQKKTKVFGKMITLAHEYHILNDIEASELHGFRKVRNALVHGSVDKLNQMSKTKYEGLGVHVESVGASLYLNSIGAGGISVDAKKYLQLTRDLSLKFYGEH
jgi:hypothetical protein